MVSLLSLQKDFFESYQGRSSFANYLKGEGPSSKHRLEIYYNNITFALRKALAISYPLTWKLIGEDCANGAAYAFIQAGTFLPIGGTLDKWSSAFPDFLDHFSPTQNLAYLSDFARLEWCQHVAYSLEDKRPLTVHDFKDVAPESYAKLCLKLHPTVQLFSSPYPLDQVMAVVKGEVDTVELDNRKANALIVRPCQSVNIHWLSEAEFTFFLFIHQGYPLIKVLEKMENTAIQLHEILSFCLQKGLFLEYTFTSEQEEH
ncbi:MAG: DNA-binding domain-containing protein [Alphaproteobacteria bacterium]|nr:DNA-binding domain-containing protein [Alphaproteobacteria bacterium]